MSEPLGTQLNTLLQGLQNQIDDLRAALVESSSFAGRREEVDNKIELPPAVEPERIHGEGTDIAGRCDAPRQVLEMDDVRRLIEACQLTLQGSLARQTVLIERQMVSHEERRIEVDEGFGTVHSSSTATNKIIQTLLCRIENLEEKFTILSNDVASNLEHLNSKVKVPLFLQLEAATQRAERFQVALESMTKCADDLHARQVLTESALSGLAEKCVAAQIHTDEAASSFSSQLRRYHDEQAQYADRRLDAERRQETLKKWVLNEIRKNEKTEEKGERGIKCLVCSSLQIRAGPPPEVLPLTDAWRQQRPRTAPLTQPQQEDRRSPPHHGIKEVRNKLASLLSTSPVAFELALQDDTSTDCPTMTNHHSPLNVINYPPCSESRRRPKSALSTLRRKEPSR